MSRKSRARRDQAKAVISPAQVMPETKVAETIPPETIEKEKDTSYPVTAFIDESKKDTWIVCSLNGDTININHTADVELDEVNETARITGKIVLRGAEEEPKGRIIGELIPYLETKINDPIITLREIPYILLSAPVIDNATFTWFGDIIPFENIPQTSALIVKGGATTAAVLASGEDGQAERFIFVYKDAESANLALIAFKTFPPFKNHTFYESAEVVTLDKLDTTNLGDELFIIYDVWQKSVANLSSHMSMKDKTEDKD